MFVFHCRKIKFSIKDFFIFYVVFIVFCKESRIWVAKKLILFKKIPEATTQRYSFKVFFQVDKFLKRTCEVVRFLVKLQVESLEVFTNT